MTSRWLQSERALEGVDLTGSGRGAELASMDLDDLRAATICISFTEDERGQRGRGGRHTELGIALALNMRVILVGPREHVFHCLPTVEHYPSWDEARRALLADHLELAGNAEPVQPSAPVDGARTADELAVF